MAFLLQRCYTPHPLTLCSEKLLVLIRSNLVYLSAACLTTASLMLSCGSSAHPDRLTVRLPPHFSGSLHVTTCIPNAPAEDIPVDDRGLGQTSLCPDSSHSIELEVIAEGRHIRVAVPQAQIHRTGDGIATSIDAQFPQ
jgi:hypothetical protein